MPLVDNLNPRVAKTRDDLHAGGEAWFMQRAPLEGACARLESHQPGPGMPGRPDRLPRAQGGGPMLTSVLLIISCSGRYADLSIPELWFPNPRRTQQLILEVSAFWKAQTVGC